MVYKYIFVTKKHSESTRAPHFYIEHGLVCLCGVFLTFRSRLTSLMYEYQIWSKYEFQVCRIIDTFIIILKVYLKSSGLRRLQGVNVKKFYFLVPRKFKK